MRIFVALVFGGVLSACGPLPDLPESAISTATADEYVDFVPLDQVVLEQQDSDEKALETEEELENRVASLRARAGRLRRASIE